GIKPFYWARQGNTLFFGSEVKSFKMHPNFVARLDQNNIDEYFAFRYCAADRFLLKDVRQLRPGHYLSFSSNGCERIHKYYSIPDSPTNQSSSRDELVGELEKRLCQSVRSQLISDVKVGCQLSGGIDSSLITIFAGGQGATDLDSFSIIFRDQKFSEERWISQASLAAHVDNHRFYFDADNFFKAIEPATWHLDQPINHPNSLGI